MSIDPEIVAKAQAVFDHAGGRSLRAYRLIASLLEFMRYGEASAREGFVGDSRQAIKQLVARPDFGTDDQREAAIRSLDQTAEATAGRTITDAITAAEAASIVFMHSMLDAAAHDYCRVCALLDPTDWISKVETEKVTLAQARNDWDELLRAAVAREVNRLQKESLSKKIEVLQAVCKCGSAQVLKNYSYDADRVKRIDDFRHGLVHQRIVKSTNDVISDLDFTERTQVYLSALVTHRHGIKLGPDAMAAVRD
jgi:hypothetical protein